MTTKGHACFATLSLSLTLLTGLAAPSARAAAGDLDALARRSAQELRDATLAGLRARDAELANVEYELDARSTRLPPSGAEEPLRRSTYAMRHAAGKTLYHVQRFFASGKLDCEFDTLWDGKAETSLTRATNGLTGLVRDARGQFIFMIHYNDMLGWERTDGVRAVDWLARAARDGRLTAAVVERKGRRLVELTARDHLAVERYWVDADRGFMIVGHHDRYERGPQFNDFLTEVDAADQVDGVWVPTRVAEYAATSATPDRSRDDFELKSARRNRVDPATLVVKFPPGTEVLDVTGGDKKHYVVGEGGIFPRAATMPTLRPAKAGTPPKP